MHRKIGALAMGVAALGLIASVAAHAELAAWDQARVTDLAGQLSKAADDAYTVLYKEPSLGGGIGGGGGEGSDMPGTMRRIQEEARSLSGHLEKGADQHKTSGMYKNIMESVRDLRVDAQEAFETNDVTTALAKMQDVLTQLAPYYDKNWDKKG